MEEPPFVLLCQAVRQQRIKGAGALHVVVPDGVEKRLFDGGVGGAEDVEELSADLPIGAFKLLHAAFGRSHL